jgi:PEP-CTERM motif
MHSILKFLLVLFIVLAPLPALADSYVLDIDHCTGGCGTAPFGTIDVTQGGNANTVHFAINLNSADFILTGQAGSTFAFNINGNPTISLASPSLAGWSLDSSTAGSLQADGFGNFEYSLNCCFNNSGGSNAQAGPVSFDIVSAGALTPASFAELSTGGSPAVTFALDILQKLPTGANGNSGFVGATPCHGECAPLGQVPEPSSLLLLGTGISGLALWSRKKLRT